MPKTTCGKRAPPSIKEERRRKKMAMRLRQKATPRNLIEQVGRQVQTDTFWPCQLEAAWDRLAQMLFAVIRRGFGTLLDGLVNVDAVSDWAREECVQHMVNIEPRAPHLMDFTEAGVSFDGVGRDRCMELLTKFRDMSPEDDEVSQVILGVTLAAVTHLELPYDEERLVVLDDCTRILEGRKRCEASGKTPFQTPHDILERLDQIKLVNAVLEQHNLRGMTIRKVMRVAVHA